VSDYLNQLAEHFRVLQKDEDTFDYQIECGTIAFNLETIMPIGIICSELMGNSLKYARMPGMKLNINILLYAVDNKFVFKYSDNGPGLSETNGNKNDKKMGLTLIHNMVRQLQAESRFYNENGAHFNLMFFEKKVSEI
jgi:two-component sensor histidine kinase